MNDKENSNNEQKGIKNAYTGFINNIKSKLKFTNKNENALIKNSSNDNNDNNIKNNNNINNINNINEIKESNNNNNVNNNSNNNTKSTSSINSCKDKISQKLISSIEVERNYVVFFTLLYLGSLMICMSLFMLAFIVTAPSKFSLCFAFGSLLVLISFLFYHGTKNYFMKLFDKGRFWISFLFILSIIIGIGFSLGKHYFISLICSLFQLFSLAMFILTFLPGGKKCGTKCIKGVIKSPFRGVFVKMAEDEINKQ